MIYLGDIKLIINKLIITFPTHSKERKRNCSADSGPFTRQARLLFFLLPKLHLQLAPILT